MSNTDQPLLLTPGPLTTSSRTKDAMARDWAPRDSDFVQINAMLLEQLADLVHGGSSYVAVPMPGSGSYAVEAMLTTFLGTSDQILIAINGTYAQRAKTICEIAKRNSFTWETAEDKPLNVSDIETVLLHTPSITHIYCVHCETRSGIL
jgi:2-aminoethylphosphonate-pyruvate transaminase